MLIAYYNSVDIFKHQIFRWISFLSATSLEIHRLALYSEPGSFPSHSFW